MSSKKNDVTGNVEGILRGLGDLVEKLVETGEQIKRSGAFDIDTNDGKNAKAVYGFSIKMGLDGNQENRVEPFGNIRRDEQTGKATVQEVSEPLVDVIEESDHVLVLAEMPGVADEDVQVELDGDILTLHSERGSKKYHKEIVLPCSFDDKAMERSCRNGILEVKLGK
ncbi:Hsp20/alpha crystallin family protein [Pectobacteriaceae bacterium C80]|nr:Hsp20/alpha crystallin family protein [Pectobacteriaceae bacterium C80]